MLPPALSVPLMAAATQLLLTPCCSQAELLGPSDCPYRFWDALLLTAQATALSRKAPPAQDDAQYKYQASTAYKAGPQYTREQHQAVAQADNSLLGHHARAVAGGVLLKAPIG